MLDGVLVRQTNLGRDDIMAQIISLQSSGFGASWLI
jgi:hypothetical protein